MRRICSLASRTTCSYFLYVENARFSYTISPNNVYIELELI